MCICGPYAKRVDDDAKSVVELVRMRVIINLISNYTILFIPIMKFDINLKSKGKKGKKKKEKKRGGWKKEKHLIGIASFQLQKDWLSGYK